MKTITESNAAEQDKQGSGHTPMYDKSIQAITFPNGVEWNCTSNGLTSEFSDEAHASRSKVVDQEGVLMSASPELLEALKETVNQLETNRAFYRGDHSNERVNMTSAAIVKAKALIEKAEGR